MQRYLRGRRSLRSALFIGVVTVAAPRFVLQPALGAGIASSKMPAPVFNALKSLVTHTRVRVGLFLAARATVAVVAVVR